MVNFSFYVFIIILIISLSYIFYPRYCDKCKNRMDLKIDENGEFIYKCSICGQIKRTKLYAQNND